MWKETFIGLHYLHVNYSRNDITYQNVASIPLKRRFHFPGRRIPLNAFLLQFTGSSPTSSQSKNPDYATNKKFAKLFTVNVFVVESKKNDNTVIVFPLSNEREKRRKLWIIEGDDNLFFLLNFDFELEIE
ncbi:unnamed protein product [Lactuca saligna]|uniref:Uncharacterized protein n=1 Tax=Lactuca saligna TaxID=75948 RepID=A0AA35ZU57_LACSI|nr:unnamed protein product [Lactuca saligna]